MDENGKIKGKTPIFNEVLAFIYSKIGSSDVKNIADVVSTFYIMEDLKEARDILFPLINPEPPRLRSRGDIAYTLVYHLKANLDKMNCIFLALDLNLIPYFDEINYESVALFMEQNRVQIQLQEVLDEQATVQAKLAEITAKLDSIREERNQRIHWNENRTPVHSPQPIIRTAETHKDQRKSFEFSKQLNENSAMNERTSERSGTMAEVVKAHVPRGFTLEADGFLKRNEAASHRRNSLQQRPQRPQRMVAGVRSQARLKPTVNDVRIFATRLNPEESEADIQSYVCDQTGAECSVEKIVTRTKRHSSFIITASRRYEQALLDPNTWEEGVLVRHFYGKLKMTERSTTD